MPSSHLAPINSAARAQTEALLADAFTEFIGSAARLEDSYRALQGEVAQLRAQLEDRNAALQSSMAETERMRSALQRILDSLPCGVIVLDHPSEGKSCRPGPRLERTRTIASRRILPQRLAPIRLLNPEAVRLLGLSSTPADCNEIPGEAGESLRAAYQSIGGDSTPTSAIAAQATASVDAEQEFSIATGNGRRWLSIRHRQLDNPNNKDSVHGQAVLILRDITLHKKLEEEREAARNQIALAQMATILAHEIRNPLASMELFSDLIEEREGEQGEWISHLKAGIRTLAGIVNNVLCFNSPATPRVARLQLSAVLRSGLDFVQPIAKQSGVTVSLHENLGGLEIRADESALRQVIMNLACNAFRHTPAGGKLTVTASRQPNGSGARAVIEFSDTGSGIAPEYVERIFEPGFSVSGHTPGLGLAVCQKIVEQHAGSISVISRPREGTTFRLEFPAQ